MFRDRPARRTVSRKKAAKVGGALAYKVAAGIYINKAPGSGEYSRTTGKLIRAGVAAGVPLAAYGAHKGIKKMGGKHMPRKGVTHIKANEANGRAGVKQKSKGEMATGFQFGLNKMTENAYGQKNKNANNNGASLRPRKGVWNPGAERP